MLNLSGWVSIKSPSERARESDREGDCGGTLFILPRPDGEGSFGAAHPLCLSGHDTHAHTHTITSTCLCSSGFSVFGDNFVLTLEHFCIVALVVSGQDRFCRGD